jgi:hypothetical protein
MRFAPASVRAVACTALVATAVAFAQPTWVTDPEGAYPGRQAGLQGLAYVEATTFPADLTQDQTGLFVACDGAEADAFDLFLWVGALPAGAVDATGTLEVLTRRGADAARSARWRVDVDSLVGEVVVATPAVRRLLLDDLRLGGTLAVRLAVDPAAGAAQPTFVYAVDGFPDDVLACASRASAASDPFAGAAVVPVEPAPPTPADPFAGAPVAPVDPFAAPPAAPADPFAAPPAAPAPADPFGSPPAPAAAPAPATPPAPADPFAAPPAPSDPFGDAPSAPGDDGFDDLLVDPTTGLLTLFGSVDDFAPLPPHVELTTLIAEPNRAVLFSDQQAGFGAIGGFCNPEGGGGNGFVVELGSPAFDAYGETATLVLFDLGFEVGYIELGVYRDDAGAAGFIAYDDDELGLLRALEAFPMLEAVLSGDGGSGAEAYWTFETGELRAAIAGLECAP